MRSERARFTSTRILLLTALAGLYTLLNAVKPLHIDDTAYYYYAAQVAQKPLDPYGFDIHWYDAPQPANTVLAPPLLPYWWSLAMRLFGTNLFLWKLWLFPFAWLFVWSLDALFRRFARGLEAPLTIMTVLSPTFLPSLNVMLDVPALALSLTALALFFRSVERRSWLQAAAVGLVAGLAMQTKYTAFLAPAVMLLYVVLRRSAGSLAFWALAAGIAAAVFVGWEAFVAYRYNVSHFRFHYQQAGGGWADKCRDLSVPLVISLGGLAPAGILLGMAGMGWRRLWVVAACCFLVLGFLGVVLVGVRVQIEARSQVVYLSWELLIFALFGVLLLANLACVARILTRLSLRAKWSIRRRTVDWFLVLWLGLEIAGYFALTPFAAARRVMELVVVVTLVLGRLASLTCRRPDRRTLIWGITGINAVLGFLYYAVDLREAGVRKQAAEEAAVWIRRQDPNPRIWFVGHWGFQYYAEQAGMKAVVPGETVLEKGDWLVVPDENIHQQPISITNTRLEQQPSLVFDDCLPLRTVWPYYGTRLGNPLEHRHGQRLRIDIYRATAAVVAQ